MPFLNHIGAPLRLLLLGFALATALACGGGGNSSKNLPPSNPGIAWNGAQVLETNLLFNSRYPTVAVGPTGDALVAWKRDSGGVYDAWAKSLNASTGWQPEGTIESVDGNVDNPQVAVSANGSFMVTWDQVSPSNGDCGVYVRKWVPGSNMTYALRLNDPSAFGYAATVAMDRSGNACVAWAEFVGAYTEIKASRFTAATGAWSAPQILSAAGVVPAHALWPVIAMDPSGNTAVVWIQSADPSNGPFSLHGAFYTSGGAWTSSASLQAGLGNVDANCTLTMSNAGGFLAWSETMDGGASYQIYTRRWIAGSTVIDAPVRVSSPTEIAYSPKVALDAQGNAWLAWEQKIGSSWGLVTSRFTPSAGWSTTPQTLLTGAGQAGNVRLSMNASGSAAMVWQQMNDGSQWSINGSLCAAGGNWGASVLLETSNAGHAYSPEVHMGANGQAVAVWYQLDAGGIRHIYANRAK